MIDIHSHILPSVDDGVRRQQEAIEMLRITIDKEGVKQALTPHIQAGGCNNSKQALADSFTI
ncbi:MAG: CpsB/CapC family capsule biosynthesis tyrosine phosphatase [Paraglaciecola sp.]|uniref:CpsB/CapC family capsule biosynthesis tyrosine phosphatase n=1 Tax=Paraglaciecola sp. TaxID=1920173 RepID=UPI003299762C